LAAPTAFAQGDSTTEEIMKSLAIVLTMLILGDLPAADAAEPVELDTFRELARPEPTIVLRYGAAPSQVVDVFLPNGNGPHPVAILIHGGCWRDLPGAGREQLRPVAAELASQGIAVWSIGYRRADEDGGGYPGTFQDVGVAVDQLRSYARRYRFDLSRTVLVGHSAGGHLALWAAARDHLLHTSPLYRAAPLTPHTVISLAGIGDLEAFARFVPLHCGPGVLDRLIPATDPNSAYAEISPSELAPTRARLIMISGVVDRLVPPYVAHDFARAMRRKHAAIPELVDVPDAGHFDLVTPGTGAWHEVRTQIIAALHAP
jgi:acetyl esterase/lipase